MTSPHKAIQSNLTEFNQIHKEMEELYHTMALSLNLSDSAFTILYALYEQGDGCLQKDICQEFCLSKQTVNSSIKKLEQHGYLLLEQGQGRDKRIIVTAKGSQLLEEKIRPVFEMEQQAFAQMTPEENSMLLRLNRKYCDMLRKQMNAWQLCSGSAGTHK